MQGNGAEMLRLACCFATERGIGVCAPVHDAILVEAPSATIFQTVEAASAAMAEASATVLGGFSLRTEAKIIAHPDRYSDPRGDRMWATVWRLIGTSTASATCAAVQHDMLTGEHPPHLISKSLSS